MHTLSKRKMTNEEITHRIQFIVLMAVVYKTEELARGDDLHDFFVQIFLSHNLFWMKEAPNHVVPDKYLG
ncbi:hypothetical protein ACJX0J_009680, partial [Zea mays]